MKLKLEGTTKVLTVLTNVPKATYERKKTNWRTSNKDINVMTIMNLVCNSKMKGVNESGIRKTLLKHRWDVEILKSTCCLNKGQVAKVIYKIGEDLKVKYDWNS